jgi:hypothetical protein
MSAIRFTVRFIKGGTSLSENVVCYGKRHCPYRQCQSSLKCMFNQLFLGMALFCQLNQLFNQITVIYAGFFP